MNKTKIVGVVLNNLLLIMLGFAIGFLIPTSVQFKKEVAQASLISGCTENYSYLSYNKENLTDLLKNYTRLKNNLGRLGDEEASSLTFSTISDFTTNTDDYVSLSFFDLVKANEALQGCITSSSKKISLAAEEYNNSNKTQFDTNRFIVSAIYSDLDKNIKKLIQAKKES